jgi:hypothetical protein
MKLRYLFPSLIAMAAMFVGCSDDNDPTYLDEVRLSSSYIAIDANGGSTTITVDAKTDWALEKIFPVVTTNANGEKETTYVELPSWLHASQLSGTAGQSQVTFSADATLDGRTAELQLVCGGKTQHINVIQGLSTVSDATCAEVIAGPDSKTYRVTGTCTSIVNTTYGNWYLTDDTGQIYIYGTLDAKGATKNFLSLGLEVGDIVTVEGPKTTYGTTVELVDVTVVSIQKSLIKVDSLSVADGVLPLEGGEITAYLLVRATALPWRFLKTQRTGFPSVPSIRALSQPSPSVPLPTMAATAQPPLSSRHPATARSTRLRCQSARKALSWQPPSQNSLKHQSATHSTV